MFAKLSGTARIAVWLVALAVSGGSLASAGTLDNIKQNGSLRIAYRTDAPPFSFKNARGEPAGFMVELCRAVVAKMSADLGKGDIKIEYVPVGGADRFDAIVKGKADLLCEPTSVTLSRRATVDFSIPTFIDGAGMMIRDDGPRALEGLAGKKVGVLGGTTTEATLRSSLKSAKLDAEIVPVQKHSDGVEMLDGGKITAYFADRSILMFLVADSSAPKRLLVADQYLTLEPYALALPHGDEDFRLAVDRALSHIYRSDEIIALFKRVFNGRIEPTDTLKTLYLVSALPD